jgi:tetratricopeptide (TPR) repeat protein
VDGRGYYVYAAENSSRDAASPDLAAFIQVLRDLEALNGRGNHVLNLRPEYLHCGQGTLRILPGAYILPIELLARSGTRSPYAPPEFRHAGFFSGATDGYELAAVLASMAERDAEPVPAWFSVLAHLQRLEPSRRPALGGLATALERGENSWAPETLRRGVERLADLRSEGVEQIPREVIDAVDTGLMHLAEGRSTVLVLQSNPDRAGLRAIFFALRSQLALLTERPRILWVDPLASWDARDLAGGGVFLVSEPTSEEAELLPNARLASERHRPALWIIGARRGKDTADAGDDLASLTRPFGPDVSVHCLALAESAATTSSQLPASSAARHLFDLLSVFGVDATTDMLRLALLQMKSASRGHRGIGTSRLRAPAVRRRWMVGAEPRLVLRLLRPEVFEARRNELSPERREELHLLLSHLLEGVDARTVGQRILRFQHLFAGGNWESAASECVPLLKWVQKRGPEPLARALQRRLVNSNLTQHVPAAQLIETLYTLGNWEVQRGRMDDGQAYFERAVDRLFALEAAEAADLSLDLCCDLLLAHADLLQRRGAVERALELLQRALDRFDERLQVLERGGSGRNVRL